MKLKYDKRCLIIKGKEGPNLLVVVDIKFYIKKT